METEQQLEQALAGKRTAMVALKRITVSAKNAYRELNEAVAPASGDVISLGSSAGEEYNNE